MYPKKIGLMWGYIVRSGQSGEAGRAESEREDIERGRCENTGMRKHGGGF